MAEGNRMSIIDHLNYANISVDFFSPYFFFSSVIEKKRGIEWYLLSC